MKTIVYYGRVRMVIKDHRIIFLNNNPEKTIINNKPNKKVISTSDFKTFLIKVSSHYPIHKLGEYHFLFFLEQGNIRNFFLNEVFNGHFFESKQKDMVWYIPYCAAKE